MSSVKELSTYPKITSRGVPQRAQRHMEN